MAIFLILALASEQVSPAKGYGDYLVRKREIKSYYRNGPAKYDSV